MKGISQLGPSRTPFPPDSEGDWNFLGDPFQKLKSPWLPNMFAMHKCIVADTWIYSVGGTFPKSFLIGPHYYCNSHSLANPPPEEEFRCVLTSKSGPLLSTVIGSGCIRQEYQSQRHCLQPSCVPTSLSWIFWRIQCLWQSFFLMGGPLLNHKPGTTTINAHPKC